MSSPGAERLGLKAGHIIRGIIFPGWIKKKENLKIICITAAESVYMWVTPVCVYVYRAELSIYTHFILTELGKHRPLGYRFPLNNS